MIALKFDLRYGRYFNCVWCKRSGRKHKKWEGDAVLRVAASSATLIDDAGRELARATGYRKHQLEEVKRKWYR